MKIGIADLILLVTSTLPWYVIVLVLLISSSIAKKLGKFLWDKFVQAIKKLGKFLWKKFVQAVAKEMNKNSI